MSNLDDIKNMILRGDKEEAINLLISTLKLNSKDIDAWLLLGEVIDDPAKKRDGYNQVLKLSPNNSLAMNGLLNLDASWSIPMGNSATSPLDAQPIHYQKTNSTATMGGIQDLQANYQYRPDSVPAESSSTLDNLKAAIGIIIIIAAAVIVIYVVGVIMTPSDAVGDSSPFYTGLFFIVLIVGIWFWRESNKSTRSTIQGAIQKQKQTSTYSLSAYSSVPQSNTVTCRTCQHSVSRTAPSCPNCGELYPGLISGCPYCGSKNIRITPKGFSLGKATAGAVVVGPIGVAGGLLGRKDLDVRCLDCPHIFTIKYDEIK